jgi:hypothetical protein
VVISLLVIADESDINRDEKHENKCLDKPYQNFHEVKRNR